MGNASDFEDVGMRADSLLIELVAVVPILARDSSEVSPPGE